MGFYINPTNMTKENWLKDNSVAVMFSPPDWKTVREKNLIPVCLVNNGPFNAAGICYSEREMNAFNLPTDEREKVWCIVPQEKIYEIMPEIVGLIE